MAEFQRPESGVGQSRRGVSEKRPRGSPTGITPLQKGKRPAVQPKDTEHRPGKRPQSRRRLPFSSKLQREGGRLLPHLRTQIEVGSPELLSRLLRHFDRFRTQIEPVQRQCQVSLLQ